MTEFRDDLEYWTDELINVNNDLSILRSLRCDELQDLTYEDFRYIQNTLGRLGADLHWLDQVVNHYPKPPKKFWQFWKK